MKAIGRKQGTDMKTELIRLLALVSATVLAIGCAHNNGDSSAPTSVNATGLGLTLTASATLISPLMVQLHFLASGGTPPYVSYIVTSGGGTINGSTYTAPSTVGTSQVTVTDSSR